TAYHYRWLHSGSLAVGFQYTYGGLTGDLAEMAHVVPRATNSLSLGFTKRVARNSVVSPFDDPIAFTPILDVVGPDRVLGTPDFNTSHQIFDVSAHGFRMDVDAGPPLWIGTLSFGPTTLYLSAQLPLLRSPLFTSPLGGTSDG